MDSKSKHICFIVTYRYVENIKLLNILEPEYSVTHLIDIEHKAKTDNFTESLSSSMFFALYKDKCSPILLDMPILDITWPNSQLSCQFYKLAKDYK